MQQEINAEDIRKALSILSRNDLGKNILLGCQNENFDVSEVVLVSSDGKRGARCFRQMDGKRSNDLVSVNKTFLQDDIFKAITTDDEKYQMLANLIAHELTHAAQYGRNPDLIPIENDTTQNEKSNEQSFIDEAIMESLMEADCRAVQFMMAISSQSPVVLKTLEKQHLPSNSVSILDKNDYTIWKLKYMSADNHNAIKKQQAFREIFRNILTSYADVYEKQVFPKQGIAQKIDFNGYENLIAGIYDEKKYGSPRQFADTIPNLREENKTILVGTILSQKQVLSKQHNIQVASLKENIFVNNIKSTRNFE